MAQWIDLKEVDAPHGGIYKFKVGEELKHQDVAIGLPVICKRGWSPCKIIRTDGKNTIWVEYYESGYKRTWHITDLCKCIIQLENQEENENMTKLYKFTDEKGVEHYGEKVGVNREGLWVMDVKDLGYMALKKSDLEEVVPYSVGVKFMGNCTIYHYWAKEGELSKGDMVYVNNSMAKVVRLDTKSSRANKWLEGFKFEGTVLTAENEFEVESDD